MADMQRLFIASPVSGAVAETLEHVFEQRDAISAKLPQRIRWVPPEQWHLTWLFLGHVAAERMDAIRQRLDESMADAPPVPVVVQDVALWPKPRKPRLLVCRLAPSPALLDRFQCIAHALPDYPPDHAFQPHITLARFKNVAATPNTAGNSDPACLIRPLPPAAGVLDQVILYRSALKPTGPVYTPIHRISWTDGASS
jgi:2'-5' RNA ligase